MYSNDVEASSRKALKSVFESALWKRDPMPAINNTLLATAYSFKVGVPTVTAEPKSVNVSDTSTHNAKVHAYIEE